MYELRDRILGCLTTAGMGDGIGAPSEAMSYHEIKEKYGDERRTEITYADGDVNIEDIIANEPCVVTLSNRGYIKRGSLSAFDEQ